MAKKYNASPEEINFYENNLNFEETPQGMEITDKQMDFYETQNPQSLPAELPWYQSIPNAIGKGLLNGLQGFGQAFGPLQQDNRQELIEYINNRGQGNEQSFEEYLQANSQPSFSDNLNQFLPTNEGFLENTIARAGNILPFLLTGNIYGGTKNAIPQAKAAGQALSEGLNLSSGPLKEVLLQRAKDIIGPIGRSLAGGAGGAVAESYGAPEWVQGLAEIPGQMGPAFSSRLSPNTRQASLVQEARNLGLTDQQITPLIQSRGKANVLGALSEKRFRTPSKLQNSYEAITRTYDALAARPEAKKALNAFQFQRLGADIQDKLKNMPAGVRDIINTDLQDLLNSNRTGNDIINFYRDLNYYIADPKLNASQLGTLKGPITTALGQLSPELARDFNTTNKLYSGYQNIASRLNPSISSDLLQGGKAVYLLHGLITGNFPEVARVVGAQAGTMLAAELLTNPRFQNYSTQMINALNKNQIGVAKKVLDSMKQLARETNPELGVYLQQINLPNLNRSGREDLQVKETQKSTIRTN